MRLSDRIANALALDTFDRRHKIGLLLLVVAMLSIVTLWFVQLRRNIVEPLYANNTTDENNQLLNQQNSSQADLQSKDTDGDGLNDWDELNLYKTSPYLADTDSDGFDDKKEIESGNDPTCPQGQTCTVSTSQTTTTNQDTTFNNPTLENLLNQGTGVNTNITPTTSPATSTSTLSADEKKALQETFGSNPDVTELRKFMLQAGMEQRVLDNLTDQEIISTFNEMVK